jgi:hypothetical protein
MWYIVYKTVCLVNGRVYFGIHRTDDPFFGSESYFDGYVGDTLDINRDLKQFGRKAFHVDGIEAYTDRSTAERRLEPFVSSAPVGSYHTNVRSESQKGLQNALGAVRSEEFKQAAAERVKGENNPFYGQKHSEDTKTRLKEHRAGVIWINDLSVEKQIQKDAEIPDGWQRGRLKNNSTLKVKMTKTEKLDRNQSVSNDVTD